MGFSQRREALFNRLTANEVVILPAAPELIRNNDSHYAYRQDSDFYYLTGFEEPEAVAVFLGKSREFILFTRPNNPDEERWTGKRLGVREAGKIGADGAYPISEFSDRVIELIGNVETIYYPMGRYADFDLEMMQTRIKLQRQIRSGQFSSVNFSGLESNIHEMRLIKDEDEIANMRHVSIVSADAHTAAMKACRDCRTEYELAAYIHFEFERAGCQLRAYNTIVGAGENACTLHYVENKSELVSGDLVLIDAGAEYKNYAADITRTFPVSGVFSEAQAALYDAVLRAQMAAIACIKPGVLWNEMQAVIVDSLVTDLLVLGILSGDKSRLIAERAYAPYYMHNSGHWLGLDVHDCGAYKIENDWRPLQAGMVLTVEPGLYISQDADVDPKWRGIGIRIEDDVLVTKQGYEVLTQSVPKTREAIEALMRSE